VTQEMVRRYPDKVLIRTREEMELARRCYLLGQRNAVPAPAPWWNTRAAHITEVVLGTVLSLAAVSGWVILTVGGEWLIGGVTASVCVVACLARFARGGGRVSRGKVTTTTTVSWK
jgi:hypothetical protein